jgi:hypothetical protein
LPVLSNKDLEPEISNWESGNQELFELIEAPIRDSEAVIGSIGSKARKDYAAIGSVVNMAARFRSHASGGRIKVAGA